MRDSFLSLFLVDNFLVYVVVHRVVYFSVYMLN
jgi:hypothetical protein